MNSKEKIKLSIDNQILDLKNKGIQFSIYSENKAKRFLKDNTYYFKLKSYAKNYSNDNKEHQYKNLDFGHLVELSKIDAHLRKLILEMCLDIEHILKARLIYDSTINDKTNGFDIVTEFLDCNFSVVLSLKTIAKGKSASASLASKYYDSENDKLKPIPLWVIVELLAFGDFLNLYTFYYQKYKRYPDYSSYLGSVKYLRNACAHNNCLIYSLKKVKTFSKTTGVMNALSKAKHIGSATKDHKMSIPVIHDFVTLLLVYNDLLATPANKHMKDKTMKRVRAFFLADDGKIMSKATYFKENDILVETYNFICQVLDYIENEPKSRSFKRFLKTI